MALYTYDANGNRLSRTVNGAVESYTVNARDELTEILVNGQPAKTFAYDLAGRTTSVTVAGVGITSYAYDYEGRLTQAVYPNLASDAFAYNGLGARVAKTDAAGAWSYRRAGAGATSPVLSDGLASYTPGVSERRGGTSRFSHSGLKSFDAQTDGGGALTGSRRYDAFGNLAATSGWSGPFAYGGAYGYQEDAGSGLKLLGHRYYDSSTGRFLTRDPASDGRNWYAYCGGNPVAFADPSGRWIETVFDFLGLAYDVGEFVRDPNLENGLMLAWSIGAVFAPGVPGSYVGRAAKGGLKAVGKSANQARKHLAPKWRTGDHTGQLVEKHHPLPREHAKQIPFDHWAKHETVPVPMEIHRGNGGLHGTGYNTFIGELIKERGGHGQITEQGLDEIMDILRDLGLR